MLETVLSGSGVLFGMVLYGITTTDDSQTILSTSHIFQLAAAGIRSLLTDNLHCAGFYERRRIYDSSFS